MPLCSPTRLEDAGVSGSVAAALSRAASDSAHQPPENRQRLTAATIAASQTAIQRPRAPIRSPVCRHHKPLGSRTMYRLRSFLRSSRSSRALFAIIGVLATWNLGCVGFQPLLVHMIGSAASMGMVCDAEGMLAAATSPHSDQVEQKTEIDRSSTAVAPVPADDDTAGHPVSCGCQSCHAPPSALEVIAAERASIPLARTSAPVAPPSTVRAPLVPPPQAVL